MKIESCKIILASGSPRRLELLRQVGIEPIVEASSVEEVVTSSVPEQVVMELSRQKAEDVAAHGKWKKSCESAMLDTDMVAVLGADTVVAADGHILGKPKNREDAIRMITMLQGRSHQVYTGVTLVFCGRTVTFAEKTDVEVYPMTRQQIEQYVDTGEPMDKAGAYGIQGRFAAYVKGICGDYNNVVGLPLARVCQELMGI